MNQDILKPMRDDGYLRMQLTFDDYCALLESGNLPRRKVELIEGEIIFKTDSLGGVDLASEFPLMPMWEDGYVRKQLTLSDCEVLESAGLLEAGRYELIEGEVVYKMPQDLIHAAVVSTLMQIFFALFGAERVFTQATLKMAKKWVTSGPEPDLVVLRLPMKHYYTTNTDPLADVLLVVEVANTTLKGDTTTKEQLYARNAIPEYWIVAIERRELRVYRDPTLDGYTSLRILTEGETVSPLSSPETEIEVSDLMP